MEGHGECMLLLIGATSEDEKELTGFEVGERPAKLHRLIGSVTQIQA